MASGCGITMATRQQAGDMFITCDAGLGSFPGDTRMKTALEQLTACAAYHRDRRNIATHLVGVPMIVQSNRHRQRRLKHRELLARVISVGKEVLHLVHEGFFTRIVGAAVLAVDLVELAQQLLLARGKVDRSLDHHMAEEIAGVG
jgi:uncharacterized membrane protein YGL010W